MLWGDKRGVAVVDEERLQIGAEENVGGLEIAVGKVKAGELSVDVSHSSCDSLDDS